MNDSKYDSDIALLTLPLPSTNECISINSICKMIYLAKTLDDEFSSKLFQRLNSKGETIVMVSHDDSFIKLANRKINLNKQ